MSFAWIEYLNVANELAADKKNKPCTEAMARAAVSRAYYAVYHVADAQLVIRRKLSLSDGSDSRHKMIQKSFEDHSHPFWKRVGRDYKTLRQARTTADYRDQLDSLWGTDDSGRSARAEALIKLATKLIDDLSVLPDSD